ncbi:MAG: hypothetical protein RL648_338 [Verrucomicrobiota bacterium]|jgi:transketolase
MTEALHDRLVLKTLHLRKRFLRAIRHAGAGHTGGSLSCIDILTVLYHCVLNISPETVDHPDRDRYIQSKGHSVEALYAVLADRGFFPESDLDTLCRYQSAYVGHPTRKVRGIEQNTGALGHGLPIAVGTALGAHLKGRPFRVFTLLGDGEMAEGSNWEAAMAAAHYQLDNLTAVIDLNGLQITGPTDGVMSTALLSEKFAAFGWAVQEVDGHDLPALAAALASRALQRKPTVVIARTIKGKGISFMENVSSWHHGVPSEAEYKQAISELDGAIAKMGGLS